VRHVHAQKQYLEVKVFDLRYDAISWCPVFNCKSHTYKLLTRRASSLRKTLITEMRVSCQEWPKEIRLDAVNGDDVMYNEELAATEAAKRAFHVMNHTEDRPSWKTKDALLEATNLVVWVLRGCGG
jgi:hypothetical protein